MDQSMREVEIDAELSGALDQTADVVGKNLAEHFAAHGGLGAAPHVVAELRLDHVNGRLDARPDIIIQNR